MSKNFLLIVEGAVTEKSILESVLKECNAIVVSCDQIDLQADIEDLFAGIYDTSNDDKIYIIQGHRNRIRDWLKSMKTSEEDFEHFFSEIEGQFAGVFIIFDVDHTSKEDLEEMYNKYNDETSNGLLLLSSPCIEVLADTKRTEPFEGMHLSKYKALLNTEFSNAGLGSAEKYIIDNFNELALFYLDKNTNESGLQNVMLHPQFVLTKINELNEREYESREVQPVIYRYFTTVLYVCIAYINGLVKEFENVQIVKNFFLGQE